MSDQQPVAVVTGGNRGIGFEISRQLGKLQYKTVLTSRDGLKGKAAADKLQSEGLDVVYHPLDVTRPESVHRLLEFLGNAFGRLDVLVNNAGIFPDGAPDKPQQSSVLDVSVDVIETAFDTNLYGPLRVSQALLPLMRQNGYGRIVNLSTGLAQLSEMRGSFPAYRFSKTSLNALTRMFAAELRTENILVNAVDPGWVKTKMGGPNATRSPAEAMDTIIWLATLPDDGPTGGFFRDRKSLSW